MITRRKVELYFSYEGDHDRMARRGRKAELAAFAPGDWKRLDELRMRLANVKAGNTGDVFARETVEELNRQTDGPDTARLLIDRA